MQFLSLRNFEDKRGDEERRVERDKSNESAAATVVPKNLGRSIGCLNVLVYLNFTAVP